jgi:hypothetical protein
MPDPSPEQLADRARKLGTDGGSERDVLRLIQDAEAGGDEHMRAVAGQVVNWPTGPSRAPYSGVYDPQTGQPAWHESNILMEASVRIDGRRFTARHMFDPMMMEMQFGGTEDERFEEFVRYWIRSSFGGIATADDESYRYLRGKVWIVKPGDRHDLQLCAQAGASAKYPKCSAGFILRSERALSPGIFGTEPVLNGTHIAGVCPCRCHRSDPYGDSAKRTAAMYGIPDFDEDQLPEDEATDD